MKTREDLLKEARGRIPEMTVQEVNERMQAGGDDFVLLDVRGEDEWELGHLDGAVHVPRGRLEEKVEESLPDKSKEVIVYCAGGVRSLLAGETLKDLGYDQVISMDGGYGDWEDAGFATKSPPAPEEGTELDREEYLQMEIDHLEGVLAKRRDQLERTKGE